LKIIIVEHFLVMVARRDKGVSKPVVEEKWALNMISEGKIV
jgi:hypothetical protein